tara:strand:+ start:63 stop:317 length:255 start_codon:yes stop_codon:yes gene_type:complete
MGICGGEILMKLTKEQARVQLEGTTDIKFTPDELSLLISIMSQADSFSIIDKLSEDWQNEDEDWRDYETDPTVLAESINSKLLK